MDSNVQGIEQFLFSLKEKIDNAVEKSQEEVRGLKVQKREGPVTPQNVGALTIRDKIKNIIQRRLREEL